MKPKILLAMSGGVDSSAAAILLKEEYEVVGITFRFTDRFDVSASVKAAEQLKIEHHVADYRREFCERVITPFVQAWIDGTTPNPCSYCNEAMKFPALFENADRLGCEFIATGHYARSELGENGKYALKCALDGDNRLNPKDQSYMLYSLTPEKLARVVFPLGRISKENLRKIAREHGLHNADQSDSQDICFVDSDKDSGMDYVSFIESFSDFRSKAGDFVGSHGEVLGKHQGHIHYTPGQRRGLQISSHKRLYVISKDSQTNTVTLGEKPYTSEFFVKDLIWHEAIPKSADVKVRYSASRFACELNKSDLSCEDKLKVVVLGDSEGSDCRVLAAPGQRAVFYCDDKVIGGGIIC